MIVYELTHIFIRDNGELVNSVKKLGLFYSYECAQNAVQYYITLPGFCENQDAFSIQERNVAENFIDDTIYEAIVYLHSKDYEFETEIWLGLYADELTAQDEVFKYCRDNSFLVNAKDIITERIVDKCIVGRKEWSEGFSISE